MEIFDNKKKIISLEDTTATNSETDRKIIRVGSSFWRNVYSSEENLYRPEFRIKEKYKVKSEKLWRLMDVYLPKDKISIQKSIVNHIEYTLGRTRFDLDNFVIYQGVSLSVKDRLLESWNDTQMNVKVADPKRVNYLSLEFLLGRLLQNALINLDLEKDYKECLMELGYNLEDIYGRENDPALGNGGLGRLAACYLDSMTTLNYPAWGYGIRYDYGIFRQAIENNEQKELPDYWLTKGNPWEVMRLDVKYYVKFYGYCRDDFKEGKKIRVWEGVEIVIAIAYDTVIPGWNTLTCNTLRLWKSFPNQEFNFESFNKGNYNLAMEESDNASFITSVLYPNDSTYKGKELRLKQQYFFSSATIQDIMRRFERKKLPWTEFPNKNCMQLNDTHPAIAIPELLRVLLDEHGLNIVDAMDICTRTFSYTNHTVLPEALEKWPVDMIACLLPRHMEIIYIINFYFLEEVKRRYPNDISKLTTMSIIEESNPKMVRMANLCIICSHCVNGVAEIHSDLLRKTLFKDFDQFYPGKIINITNGVTPRRWIQCSFPELSNLITEYSSNNDWLADLSLLQTLLREIKEKKLSSEFINRFAEVKLIAKRRLRDWVKQHLNIEIDEYSMFDVQVKRIHEYKRQLLNILYCVHRYLTIKDMKEEDRKKLVKRVTFFGGKAAPGYFIAKSIIRLINQIANIVNNDQQTNKYFKIIFLPDYKVSLAQLIIPAADLSQHISTAGTEASGTSNMKFTMTGSLILGTRDGANIEIAKEIGEDNIFFFGYDVDDVIKIRIQNNIKPIGSRLRRVFNSILSGIFGDTFYINDYLNRLLKGNDYYLVTYDFYSYLEAQERVDMCYLDLINWYKMALVSISRMGYFSSDRSIKEYSDKIWKIEPIEAIQPSVEASKHVISTSKLKDLNGNI
jgi:starch phosphorylase